MSGIIVNSDQNGSGIASVSEKSSYRYTDFWAYVDRALGDGQWHSVSDFWTDAADCLPVHAIGRAVQRYRGRAKDPTVRDESGWWEYCRYRSVIDRLDRHVGDGRDGRIKHLDKRGKGKDIEYRLTRSFVRRGSASHDDCSSEPQPGS